MVNLPRLLFRIQWERV